MQSGQFLQVIVSNIKRIFRYQFTNYIITKPLTNVFSQLTLMNGTSIKKNFKKLEKWVYSKLLYKLYINLIQSPKIQIRKYLLNYASS